ncbi:MAG: protein kinase [Deltaproteobacteria bacterium]|nr:protein kinase [Deltaproteobacteria bacterium]
MEEGVDLAIVRRIAVGGTAEILLVREGDDPPRVLKRLLPDAGGERARRLELEREVLEQIRSPFVLRAVGGGPRHLLLEHVDGLDLGRLAAHLAKRGTTLEPGAALCVVEALCSGLEAIHAAGFVHGDVSPSNVLLSRFGEVKVADLGSARRIDAAPPAAPEGTLAYQAPEQLRLERISPRTDLFAAALVAYELIAGVPARPSGMLGVLELLEARSRLPLAPSEVRRGAPAELDAVILSALEPDPARRPPSVEAWRERLLSGSVRPDPSALERAVREACGPAIPAAATAAPAVEAAATVILPRAELAPPLRPRPRSRAIGLLIALAFAATTVAAGMLWVGRASVTSRADPPAAVPRPVSAAASTATTGGLAIAPAPTKERSASVPAPPARQSFEPRPPASRRAPQRAPMGRAPGAPRVAVEAGDVGPLHVRGAGMEGPAPLVSAPLEDRGTLIQLLAGPSELRVVLRLARDGTEITVTIGAPAGTYYRVSCDGHGARATPVLSLPLRDRLRCAVERTDGAKGTFALRLTR